MSDETNERRCLTCHWWFRFDESQVIGDCAWHTGTKKTPAAKLRFTGILETQADFGCVDWEVVILDRKHDADRVQVYLTNQWLDIREKIRELEAEDRREKKEGER